MNIDDGAGPREGKDERPKVPKITVKAKTPQQAQAWDQGNDEGQSEGLPTMGSPPSPRSLRATESDKVVTEGLTVQVIDEEEQKSANWMEMSAKDSDPRVIWCCTGCIVVVLLVMGIIWSVQWTNEYRRKTPVIADAGSVSDADSFLMAGATEHHVRGCHYNTRNNRGRGTASHATRLTQQYQLMYVCGWRCATSARESQ